MCISKVHLNNGNERHISNGRIKKVEEKAINKKQKLKLLLLNERKLT